MSKRLFIFSLIGIVLLTSCGAQKQPDPIVEPVVEEFKMPVIRINTKDGADIVSKEEYLESKITLEECDEEFAFEDVDAGIRGRGNSTWGAPKKPYRIKFNKKRSMLGTSYEAKSWTLLANYFDGSLCRNYIAYELSSKFDGIDFSSTHKFVDLYLNGDYKGVYLLADQIQTGDGRIDIDEEYYDDGNLSFLIESNYRVVDEGIENLNYFKSYEYFYEIKTPDTEDEKFIENKDLYIKNIKNYIDFSYSSLKNKKSWDIISTYLDIDSFVDSYIIQELFANTDVMNLSTYFYKNRTGKLFCGPVWDFDIGGGNTNYSFGNELYCPPNTTLWANKGWYYHLLRYHQFKDLVKQRLSYYQNTICEVLEELNTGAKDSLYDKYGENFNKNFEVWKTMGTYIWPQPKNVYTLKNVAEHMEFLRSWLYSRNTYMQSIYGCFDK